METVKLELTTEQAYILEKIMLEEMDYNYKETKGTAIEILLQLQNYKKENFKCH